MARKAGPQMVRMVIDGHVYLLPVGTVVHPPASEETLEESMRRPLGGRRGGTWK